MIRRSRSCWASACSRLPTNRSSSSGFAAGVTKISPVSVRLKPRGSLSTLQKADDDDSLLHSRPSSTARIGLQGLDDMSAHGPMPRSAWIFPALAVLLFAAATGLGITFTPSAGGLVFAAVLLVILFGTVFAAVHHAEVIAERIGEPYGTLLLTLAVTIIEVALIATIMLGEKPVPTLARDTVFAVVRLVCTALAGVCILAVGLRWREQDVQVTGSNLYLSVLIVLATITLIMPNYTLTTPGPVYSAVQLGFVG